MRSVSKGMCFPLCVTKGWLCKALACASILIHGGRYQFLPEEKYFDILLIYADK